MLIIHRNPVRLSVSFRIKYSLERMSIIVPLSTEQFKLHSVVLHGNSFATIHICMKQTEKKQSINYDVYLKALSCRCSYVIIDVKCLLWVDLTIYAVLVFNQIQIKRNTQMTSRLNLVFSFTFLSIRYKGKTQ